MLYIYYALLVHTLSGQSCGPVLRRYLHYMCFVSQVVFELYLSRIGIVSESRLSRVRVIFKPAASKACLSLNFVTESMKLVVSV